MSLALQPLDHFELLLARADLLLLVHDMLLQLLDTLGLLVVQAHPVPGNDLLFLSCVLIVGAL